MFCRGNVSCLLDCVSSLKRVVHVVVGGQIKLKFGDED